jgi:hypothetical protein
MTSISRNCGWMKKGIFTFNPARFHFCTFTRNNRKRNIGIQRVTHSTHHIFSYGFSRCIITQPRFDCRLCFWQFKGNGVKTQCKEMIEKFNQHASRFLCQVIGAENNDKKGKEQKLFSGNCEYIYTIT